MKDIVISVIEKAQASNSGPFFYMSLADTEAMANNNLHLWLLEKAHELPEVVAKTLMAIEEDGVDHIFIATEESLSGDISVELRHCLRGKGVRVDHISPQKLYRKHILMRVSLAAVKNLYARFLAISGQNIIEETLYLNSAINYSTQLLYGDPWFQFALNDGHIYIPQAS